MRNLALWLVPVLARAAAEIATASASAGVQLRGTKNADFLSFRLDVFETTEPCGLNATVGGEPLGPADASTFAFDDGLRASGSWKTLCLSEEVLLLMRIEEVMGLVVEGIDLTIRVRPTAPVEIFDIAGPAVLTHMSHGDDEVNDSPVYSVLTWEEVTTDLREDIADLQFLRDMALELEREIQFKQMLLEQLADREEEVQQALEEPHCDGFWCSLKGLFDRIIGLGHPGRYRWPGKGCNRTHGNHTHGNHTFPPPWWKHPHGNHTHGNYTHGNHTFPPPWWKHPHGNHTHGNGSHPHPPFRHRPPFFCRPHHGPGKPPHGKPPHGKPPHGKPPHRGPPHGKPPHGGPPHGKPPAHSPFLWPTEYQDPAAISQNQPHSLFYSLHPLVRTGILVTLFSLLVVALRARCRARWGHMTWAERREMRRVRCRAKRAAMRRRFRAFLDRLRPDECDDEGESDFMCGAGSREKAALLWDDATRGCQEGVVVSEKGEVVNEQEEEVVDEKENAEEEMTMSQEISSFRDVANMVGEIIAAEEGRIRV